MNFHANAGGLHHPARRSARPARFKVNGHPAKPGAPFADPCFDDAGNAITDMRYYKAADIQLDTKFNKAGWHFPQTRMISLWNDVEPTSPAGTKPPEPFFFRANSGECIEYWYTNLVPNKYVVDDFQVRTPTDILGQHIHLVKFDVTSSDGGGNGWNYEDGSFAGEEVQERIHAIREPTTAATSGRPRHADAATAPSARCAKPHPFFTGSHDADCDGHNDYLGAQTTVQRWWADPITNLDGGKRTLRTVFTHDHFGPSTHQQAGLYAGLIVEPAGTTWYHNETGIAAQHQQRPRPDSGRRSHELAGGRPGPRPGADNYREFMIEFADFQPMYEPGGPVVPEHRSRRSAGSTRPAPSIRPGREEVGLPDLYEKPDECPVPEGSTSLPAGALPRGRLGRRHRHDGGQLPQRAGRPARPRPRHQHAGARQRGRPLLRLPVAHRPCRPGVQRRSPSFYPPLTTGLYRGDPFTPLLRTFEGDQVKIRTLVGRARGAAQLHHPRPEVAPRARRSRLGLPQLPDDRHLRVVRHRDPPRAQPV